MSAITAAETCPDAAVTIYEATDQPLDKVRISGGGRCNVTHNCFDPAELVNNYPRGRKELRGPFSRFQPSDTVTWFKKRGVELHTENDGRMFPISNDSQTIIDCLIHAAEKAGVLIKLNSRIKAVAKTDNNCFNLQFSDNNHVTYDKIVITTGSSPQGYKFAKSLGHTVVPCVPSLFTFKVSDQRLENLSGLSFGQTTITLTTESRTFTQTGPMLITHWGLSGPAILKLSAFAARELHTQRYQAPLQINFLPGQTNELLFTLFNSWKKQHGKKQLSSIHPPEIPRRYWQQLLISLTIPDTLTWAEVDKKSLAKLTTELLGAEFLITGKGIFKEEFVTCGGVSLGEIDFKTMQSRLVPNLYFAGEILDVDGITGGFNFQNAWTTGWLVGCHIGQK